MEVSKIKKRYFIIMFFVIMFIVHHFVHQEKNASESEHLTSITKSIYLEYKVVYNNHKDIAELLFSTRINKDNVIQLFKNKDREALYKELLHDYKYMRNFYVRQLHFHTVNNDSFLRMHRPKKFGDNLSKARATIKYVNENLKTIDGFEEGKIFNGFRFVYPMFDENEHIGSVEISFNALAFIENFVKNYGLPSDFFILKEIVDAKLFKAEKSNYMNSPLPHYYYQKAVVDYLKMPSTPKENIAANSLMIEDKIQKGLAFSHYIKESKEIATFIPIKNPISNEVVSALCFYTDDLYVHQVRVNAIILLLSIALTVIIVLILVYKELMYNARLQKSVVEKTKKIEEGIKLLDNVIKGSNLGYWDWYPQTKVNIVDERWREMLGLEADEVSNTEDDWLKRVNSDDLKRVNPIIEKAIEENTPYNIEFRMRHKDGHEVWIQGCGCVIEKDKENRPLRVSGTHADITSRKEAEEVLLHQKEMLQYKSEHDSLTGLRNRRTLNADIEKLISNYNLHKAPYAVLMFDIDLFKKVNDIYGHDIGDDILVELSKLTTKSFRESDKIYRAGGEEFIVLLTRVSLDEVEQITQKYRLAVQQKKFQTRDCKLSITISIGLYHSSSLVVHEAREVLKFVDEALYKSKSKGRNQVTLVQK